MSDSLLSLVIFAPLLFAAVVALLPAHEKGQLRAAALVGTLVNFGLGVWLYLGFDPAATAPEFQYELKRPWIESLGISYHIGVDGMAVSLMLLTAFLGPIVVLSTFKSINDRVKEFCLSILVLQTAMYGTFAALDLALFYVFWEILLVPMYLLIGVWGSDNRIYAAVKFFLYTFAASVLMLIAILFIYVKSGAAGSRSFDYVTLLNALNSPGGLGLSWEAKKWLFLAFALAFAVKVPMFPLHTWLPDAHVEAPAAGSIILAGVLLKMGSFGFMRYAMPFFPEAATYFRPALAWLAVIGIVYGSFMSFAQSDMKKLVAYSSVAHLGFVMLGVFALTTEASTGAVYQMLNHGISTGALFLLIGIIYERTHTRQIADYGGIAKVVPMFTVAFMVVTLSSIGLPGTNGFIGEFLILVGSFTAPFASALKLPAGVAAPSMNTVVLTVVASTGVVLGAVYMLRMFQRVMFGPIRHPERRALLDLSLREWATILPLMLVAVWMGVAPQPFLSRIEPSAQRYVERLTKGPVRIPEIGAKPVAQGGNGAQVPVGPAAAAPRPALVEPKGPERIAAPAPAPVPAPAAAAEPAKPAPAPKPPKPAAGLPIRRPGAFNPHVMPRPPVPARPAAKR
jgi:NADH-quinone oxidoreductase subunit M